MVAVDRENNLFKKAVIFSVSVHILLFIIILISPYLPKSSKKGMIHYVNLIAAPGGGGGGGGSPTGTVVNETITETEVPKRETLRDLTTPQVLEQKEPSTFRHPVDKPKREPAKKPERKAVIQKSQPSSKETKGESGSGEGSGVRLGIGPGSGGGGGSGSEFSSQIGLSHFPYTYYLQILQSRISSNWFKSQMKTGSSSDAYTSVFFRIYRDGSISAPSVRESSGIRSLDLSAIRAINSSAPFPPLPQGYEQGYLGITLIFEHTK
jgi:TonB family protein